MLLEFASVVDSDVKEDKVIFLKNSDLINVAKKIKKSESINAVNDGAEGKDE